MENKHKNSLLKSLTALYDKTNKCGLSQTFYDTCAQELQTIQEYFSCSEPQAVFITLMFANQQFREIVDRKDMLHYTNANPIVFFEFMEFQKELFQKKIVYRVQQNANGLADDFYLNPKIFEAISNNLSLPNFNQLEFENVYDFLKEIYEKYELINKEKIDFIQWQKESTELLHKNKNLLLLKRLSEHHLSFEDTLFIMLLIQEKLTGYRHKYLINYANNLLAKPESRTQWMMQFADETHPLQQLKWLDIEKSFFGNDITPQLNARCVDVLNDCGISIYFHKEKNKNLILPENIVERPLFYNPKEKNQLATLEKLLQPEKFKSVQQQLKTHHLPCGMACIFYGAPGTGKTESVLQLARKTGREILKVDISQSKSMWFGKSEKIIKQVFDDYAYLIEKSDVMPILFFNEADAIFSQRKDSNSSSVAQTENAIQNIILDEMENLQGILIATTNLTQNLDTAFERRFLFKIQFQKPETIVKAKIWKSFFPEITEKEQEILAQEFDFSGGQISNIKRKVQIESALNALEPTLDMIRKFCKEETLFQENTPIGFMK